MDIFYENSTGERILFNRFPIIIQEPESLFKNSWSYTSEVSHRRTFVTDFFKELEEKTIKISVFADDSQEYDEIMENLQNITEKDVLEKIPGKLYVNGYYLKCYVTQKTYSDYDDLFDSLESEWTIVAENPLWIKEIEQSFLTEEENTTAAKKYPYQYAYRYASGMRNRSVINSCISSCNFKLQIFGHVLNPQIIIGGYEYLVNEYLEVGEYMIIDSLQKTVFKVMNNGTIVNIFDSREKKKSVFEKIKSGKNNVSWSGKFDFLLTIFEERAEPKWH